MHIIFDMNYICNRTSKKRDPYHLAIQKNIPTIPQIKKNIYQKEKILKMIYTPSNKNKSERESSLESRSSPSTCIYIHIYFLFFFFFFIRVGSLDSTINNQCIKVKFFSFSVMILFIKIIRQCQVFRFLIKIYEKMKNRK